MASTQATKSIDVGSMFLMDLSVQEAELSDELNDAVTLDTNDLVFPANSSRSTSTSTSSSTSSYPLNEIARSKAKNNYVNLNTSNHHQQQHHHHVSQSRINSHLCNNSNSSRNSAYHRKENRNEYLDDSLDKFASANQCDENHHHQQQHFISGPKELPMINEDETKLGNIVTKVEPQQAPSQVANFNQSSTSSSSSSSSSLSDEESFAASSSGGETNSLSVSYIASSGPEEDEERGSANAREDSGVLDMKNIESQLNNSYDDNDNFNCYHDQEQQNKLLHKENPISANINMATNLINRSAHNSNNYEFSIEQSNRLNKPTYSNNNNHHDTHHQSDSNHHHHRGGQTSRRPMSASLPIQVPPRQMKKNLNKLKLDLVDELGSTPTDETNTNDVAEMNAQDEMEANEEYGSKQDENSSWEPNARADDIEEFLQQEYNENHNNHYPIDEFDERYLRADENPMRLFENIQALARSLHEDTEIFGSLPPKRKLESPLRSLAFA